MLHKLISFAALLLGPALSGAQAPATAPAGAVLTIYSPSEPDNIDPREYLRPPIPPSPSGFAVVREMRRVDLGAAVTTVRLADLPAGIDPTSLSLAWSVAPEPVVLERRFEHDARSPQHLLQRYVGRDVLINRRAPGEDKARGVETREGTLLAFDQDFFVIQTRNRQMPLEFIPRTPDLVEIKAFDLPGGMAVTPTLVCKVRADKAGPQDVAVTYHVDRLAWRADYEMVLDRKESAAQLSATASILNRSGRSFTDARLKLIAGEVHRAALPPVEIGLAVKADGAAAPRAVGDCYAIDIERPASIVDGALTQVELLAPQGGVAVTKSYVCVTGQPGLTPPTQGAIMERELTARDRPRVEIHLRVQNTRKDRLGLPLPAGRVRVYRADEADGQLLFVGEDTIRHTPVDEDFTLRIGNAFDVTAGRKQTDFRLDAKAQMLSESFELTLGNHRREAVRIAVRESLPRAAQWEITKQSEAFEKLDAQTIQFGLEIPPGGQKKLSYTVKYTW